MKYIQIEYNALTELVIKSAIEVHKEIGPGLLETGYEFCLIKLLKEEGLKVESQLKIPITFKKEVSEKHFIPDILVNDVLVLEINRSRKSSQFMKLSL